MTSRWLGVLAAVVALALLGLGITSQRWLIGSDLGIQTSVGLRAFEICQDVEPEPGGPVSTSCETVPLADVEAGAFSPEGFGRFHTFARLALYAGLATGAMLVICLVLALWNKPLDLPIHPTTLAILAAVASIGVAGAMLIANPYTKLVGWGSGQGFVLYGLGASLALFAGIVLGRARVVPPSEWD